jgi:alpha-mannosidase
MLVSMVDELLELLARDPEYRFFMLDGQTVILDDYLAVRPERREDLKRLVRAGRLFVGPWYVLPDEFLVSAEATVRNLLEGTRTAAEFGGVMSVGYIPDSFGHIAMMPALLRGFGMDTALVYRGFGGEPGQTSSEYWWAAPDGTRCLMIHLFRQGYSGGYFHQAGETEILEQFRGLKEELDARATTPHRLLLNGGDHHWPDPRVPATLALLRTSFEGEFLHSNLPAYTAAVRKEVRELPEIHGELRFGYRYAFVVNGGIYSSRLYLKQRNWRCQNLLQRYVEPLNAMASAAGKRTYQPLLRKAWKTLMQNHPHDSICGCSTDVVHREMETRFQSAEDTGKSVMEFCLNELIPYDDRASGDDTALYLFNPSPFTRTESVETELRFHLQDIVVGLNPDVRVDPRKQNVAGFALRDRAGNEVPYQVLSRREGYDLTHSNYNYPRQTSADIFSLLVDTSEVPATGFARMTVERRPSFPRYPARVRLGRGWIENEHLRVEMNGKGTVTVRDRRTRRVISGLNVFEDTGDAGDEYNYSFPHKDRRILSTSSSGRVTTVERGPLRAALRCTIVMRVPQSASPDRRSRSARMVSISVTTTVYLSAGARTIVFVTTVENRAKDHRFRVLIPTGCATAVSHADSQFCVIARERKSYDKRAFTIEHPASVAPMQRFVALRDLKHAVMLMSDGLPEYELLPGRGGVLALTLLRCTGLLAGENLITRPGGKAGWHRETPDAQCPGEHTFRYAVTPMTGEEFDARSFVNEEAERFHLPVLPVRRKNPSPPEPPEGLVSVRPRRLTVSAVKQAEDGDGIVVRLYNTTAEQIPAEVYSHVPLRRASRVRLDERDAGAIEVVHSHTVPVSLGPGQVQSIRLTMERSGR